MEIKHLFTVWPDMYLFDLFRYLIPASLAFLGFWVIGRRKLRHRFIQNTFPVSSSLWREFRYSMCTVVIFSIVGLAVHYADHTGITLMYHNFNDYGALYAVLSFGLTLVFHDFYFYWTHRLMHHKKLFKYVHRVHHLSTNPSPWAAYAFHPWEALIQAMVLPVMIFLFPLHPLVILLFLAYMIVRNVMGHLGFEIMPKGFTKNKLLSWNTAVTHHNMHHEHFHGNYGLYFSWWDRWMKTEHQQYHKVFDEVKSRPSENITHTTAKRVANVGIILLASSLTSVGQSVEGFWMTLNEETNSPLSTIEIVRYGESIQGKVVKVFQEPYQGEDPICTKCEGDRKNKKVIGMNFMWGLKSDGDEWSGGNILDPQQGEIYSCRLWLDDDNTLRVRGYSGLFYRTQTWRRMGIGNEKSPVGQWQTFDDDWKRAKSVVEIKKVKNELFGYIRKIMLMPNEGPDPLCTECHGTKKNGKIVGMTILTEFKKHGVVWEDGKILDPGNGNTYTSTMRMLDNDTLEVRGYLGPFYRAQVWHRVKG